MGNSPLEYYDDLICVRRAYLTKTPERSVAAFDRIKFAGEIVRDPDAVSVITHFAFMPGDAVILPSGERFLIDTVEK